MQSPFSHLNIYMGTQLQIVCVFELFALELSRFFVYHEVRRLRAVLRPSGATCRCFALFSSFFWLVVS